MHKGTKLQIAHKYVCLLQSMSWIIGISITWMWRFVPYFHTHDFFFGVVDAYVAPVMRLSVIPVELALFVSVVVQALLGKLKEERISVHITLFAVQVILFLLFTILFVSWTGGV